MLKKRIVVRGHIRGGGGTPAKTVKKAENHSKEGPLNTTVGKSGALLHLLW